MIFTGNNWFLVKGFIWLKFGIEWSFTLKERTYATKWAGKIALFCKLGFKGWTAHFANVCNVGWFPNAPKRRNARGAKKIKTPCRGVSKSINPICLFICSHCQVSENVSKSGVWLAPNGYRLHEGRVLKHFRFNNEMLPDFWVAVVMLSFFPMLIGKKN